MGCHCVGLRTWPLIADVQYQGGKETGLLCLVGELLWADRMAKTFKCSEIINQSEPWLSYGYCLIIYHVCSVVDLDAHAPRQ